MRRVLFFLSLTLFACVSYAQTYTPKTIRVDGIPAADSDALIASSGLRSGVALTRAEIEAALGKLADTGNFTDISYTVDANALVIKVSGAAYAERKVRYANFVWWTDDELEKLVETRVPLFHGKMSAAGSLNDQVKAALVAIAKDKGITATVSSAGHEDMLVLSIDSPPIVSGNLFAPDVTPLAGATMVEFKHALHGQEFDRLQTAETIHHDVTEIYQNAGYLHVQVSLPVFAAPRAQGAGYAMDATVEVEPGALYRVGTLDLPHDADIDGAGVARAEGMRTGEPVSPMIVELTGGRLVGLYRGRGYLDASFAVTRSEDDTAHTVSFRYAVTPGAVYHLARISVEASLPADVGQALQHDKHLAAGVVADIDVLKAASGILRDHKLAEKVVFNFVPNHDDHTASLVVKPRGTVSHEDAVR